MNRAVRLTTIAFLLSAAAALATPAAYAGTYTVWSCRGPSGEPAATSGWVGEGTDGCADGGALSARADRPWDASGYRLEAPADTTIAGYRIWRYETAGGHAAWGAYAALFEDPFTRPVDGCFASAGCKERGDPHDPLAAANLVERSDRELRALEIVAGCFASCRGAEFRLFRAAVDFTDASAPVAAGAPAVDAGSVTVAASDAGGGLRSAQALIDGQPVATAGSGCAEPFTAARPCPESATFTLAFDTASLPAGEHELAVVVADAAGNATTLLTQPLTIQRPEPYPSVAPSPTPVPTAAPVAPTPTPTPGPARLRLDDTRFSAGARGTITGRATRGGAAAAGASVVVERRYYGARGGAWKRVATLTADARGGFSVRVPAVAQQLRFRLAGVTRVVDVVSKLGLSARMRPTTVRNGGSITLAGRLTGAGPAAARQPVQIQAMIGGRWQTVARVRAAADGGYRWRYRFRNTRLEALYSFRARVADDSARWPWPAIDSSRVRVHVIP